MSVYVRELLVDLAHGRLDVITRLDLLQGLTTLLATHQITPGDMYLLTKYISGVSVTELTGIQPNAEERLIRALALLEHTTGYTDDTFLRRGLRVYPKYTKIKSALSRKMEVLSRVLDME